MTAAEGKNPQNSTQTQPKLRWIRRLSRQLPDELHIMSTKKNFNFSLQCSWTLSPRQSADGPWTAGLVIQRRFMQSLKTRRFDQWDHSRTWILF